MPQGGRRLPAMLQPARKCRALLVQEEAGSRANRAPLGQLHVACPFNYSTAGLPVIYFQNKTIEVSWLLLLPKLLFVVVLVLV